VKDFLATDQSPTALCHVRACRLQNTYVKNTPFLAMCSLRTSPDGINNKSRRGRLGDGPNEISVRNTVKKFFSRFERVIKIKIPDQLRVNIYKVSPIMPS